MIQMEVYMKLQQDSCVEMALIGVQIIKQVIFPKVFQYMTDDFSVYMNDSVGQKTYAYDFDLENGTVSNRRVLVDFAGTGGEPDGLVIE